MNDAVIKEFQFQMRMIASNYQITVAYVAIFTALIHYTVASEERYTELGTGKSSNHDAFVTVDNILMDEEDQLSTNSNVNSNHPKMSLI